MPEPGAEHEEHVYSAFEHWPYKPFIYVGKDKKVWISFKESFYRGAEVIITNLAEGHGFPEIEGIAAVFLFRHYLELTLKSIVLDGRRLIEPYKNVPREAIDEVIRTHRLTQLWAMVLKDAKPKIDRDAWANYDIPFVEECIKEFDARDNAGFAFRYPKHGGERYDYDFGYFPAAMEHVYQVLENVSTYLVELHGENQEWDAIQNEF
jgi:hypothetical protein